MSSEQMLEGFSTTRMELLELKQRIRLAQRGHDLLQQKLEALTNELFTIIDVHRQNRKEVNNTLQQALLSYAAARAVMGPLKLREASLNAPELIDVETRTSNLMGVFVPSLTLQEIIQPEGSGPSYNLIGTSPVLDDAIKDFRAALLALAKLAETQSALLRLAGEISSTKRRVNALREIVIPRIENTAQFISFALAEREREEFGRLKKIKARLEASVS